MSRGGGSWPPGDAEGYGRGARYPDESGYDWSEPSGRPQDQGDPLGRGQTDPYGQRMGRHSARHSAAPTYGDSYDQGWQAGGRYAGDQPARDGYDQGGYGHGSYGQPGLGSYGEQGYGGDRYGGEPYGGDRYSGDQYRGEPYGGDQYGGDQYSGDRYGRDLGSGRYAGGSYGQEGYTEAQYGGNYYGQPQAGRALPPPDAYGGDAYRQDGLSADSYGRDPHGQAGYGSAASNPATGGYPAPDGYGQDNGYGSPSRPVRPALEAGSDPDATASYRADTGSFDRPDARDGAADGWFGQPSDTGSFGRPDTGSFGRPDTDSFRAADGYLGDGYGSDGQPDPFGPPAASLRRTELGGAGTSRLDESQPFGITQDEDHAGGYDQWHGAAGDADGWDSDEPAEPDGDWQDDADSGLLSRQLTRGNGRRSGGGDRRSGRRAGRGRRPRRLRGRAATTAAVLIGALVLGGIADFGYERFQAWHTGRYGDYQGAGSGKVRFTVQPGTALSALGPALMQAGVIMEVRPFDSAAAAASNASSLQPGIYLLHRHMSSALAVQYLLSSQHRANDQLTIIEGTRASAIAQELAKQTGIPVSQFTKIINHPPASLGLPSWAGGKTAEGFLFPDTYTLLPKMTALQILQMMVTEFKKQVSSINLVGTAHKVFTTPWHALIVASLIQAEAGSPKDFGKISRVVWNRLGTSMPLQFDSTVFYAMGKYGTHVNAQQQSFPSPYNTYQHTGLPPGPIGNPGAAAMQAAVHATKGDWVYFITDTRHKPYKTYFTASLPVLQQWQREFKN